MAKDNLTKYLRAFGSKFKHADDYKVEKFDEWFLYNGVPLIERYLKEFEKEYGIKLTEKQKQKAEDLFYKLMFVKGEFDERYDNVLIGDIIDRVLTERQKKKIRF